MIAITGACGFIGSVLLGSLNKKGISDILLVDDFEIDSRVGYAYKANYTYLQNKKFKSVHPIVFDGERPFGDSKIDFIFHVGAISNTMERSVEKINKYNVQYTKCLDYYCRKKNIPMVFTSSAAVYGNGKGPLNLYAKSKIECEDMISDHAVCLRLFNVYGPNEYHKANMSSVILKWTDEFMNTGFIDVFENSDNYFRDIVHVGDVCEIMCKILEDYKPGVYDVGSGNAFSMDSIADIVSKKTGGKKRYVKMPSELKSQYQVFTKANNEALSSGGYEVGFTDIEKGIESYIDMIMNKKETI